MNRATRFRLILYLLLPILLLAQGLRVCIHAYDAPHAAEHAHDVAATHIESSFSVLDGHGEAMTDTHITLIGILKNLTAEPLAALFFITLLLVLLRQTLAWLVQPRDRIFRPPHGHYFSPPLRAPPR